MVQMGRRGVLALGAGVPLWVTLASCGMGAASAEVASSQVTRSPGDPAAAGEAARCVAAFGGAVMGRLAAASPKGNLVFSPWSLAVACAMTRLGARGATAAAMDRAMRVRDAGRNAAGLDALAQRFASTAGERTNASGQKATIALDDATSVWGQRGLTWRPEFLDGLGRLFGAAMHLVDYGDAAGARRDVNAWTEEHTGGGIRELVPEGMFTPDTRLTLVQALHLKAPWHTAFESDRTQDGPFRTARGESVTARFMGGQTFDGVRGDGFVAARLPYAGGQLAMTVILPDAGREPATAALVRGPGLPALLTQQPSADVDLAMPRFSIATTAQLTDPLKALGMVPAFAPTAADFSGMTGDERLCIGDALQRAVITVDEEGTEAAAATAVVAMAVSGRGESVTVRLDRPFHAVVHDVATGTPLFVADVTDPHPRP